MLMARSIADQCQAWLQEVAAKLEPVPRKKRDRTALGLALYALSSCFLATMLMFAKKLGAALCISLACHNCLPVAHLSPLTVAVAKDCTNICPPSYTLR